MAPPLDDGWRDVGAAAGMVAGRPHAASVDGRPVVVVRGTAGLHALDDLCPHAEARLSEGRVRGDRIVCPLHGASFDCATGTPRSGPARSAPAVHAVRERDGRVEVRLARGVAQNQP